MDVIPKISLMESHSLFSYSLSNIALRLRSC